MTPLATAASHSTLSTVTRWSPKPTIRTAAAPASDSSIFNHDMRGAESCTVALTAIVAKPAATSSGYCEQVRLGERQGHAP